MSNKIQWTAEQSAAIHLSGGSVIVSAAAGSGKTAVLVQRVLRLLTDEKHPIPPEKLLIVTFTRAAASEMKLKIKNALRESAQNNKIAESALLHLDQAQISTMDAFCVKLVRDNFELAGVSPDFRMLDDSENKSICDTAIEQALETSYRDDPNFQSTADYFIHGRDDSALADAIRSLQEYASSYPSPNEWLDSVYASFQEQSDPFQTSWGKYIHRFLQQSFAHIIALQERAIAAAEAEEFVASAYAPSLYVDLQQYLGIKELLDTPGDWDVIRSKVRAVIKPTPLKSKKGINQYSQTTLIKSIREDVKKSITSCEKVLCGSAEDMLDDIRAQRPIISSLIHAVRRYNSELLSIKAARNAYYFNDILHFSLSLLYSSNHSLTDLAKRLSDSFDEVLIDEYQDTTRAQDALFTALSDGGKKLFVVGDVKQSIYGFRLATPEIFLEKCNHAFPYQSNTFPAKVILGKNFRSRAGILDCINFIFSRIMTRQTGDVDYNEDEYLYYGGDDAGDMSDTDILLGEDPDNPFESEFSRIAQYINEKVYEQYPIRIKGEDRPVRYSDFCILLRSVKGAAENAAKILSNAGIPVLYERQVDAFATPEARMFYSLLTVIDNPLSDVDLIAVLTSPLFGFVPDDLAMLRKLSSGNFYHCVIAASEENEGKLHEKCVNFLRQIKTYRDISQTGSISDFLHFLLEDTGFSTVIAAMPNGKARLDNLSYFVQYAKSYEQGTSIGFSGFLRYLEHIRSANKMQSVTQSVGSVGDAVQIMSIHKSKGLEFPFVILANTAKTFNMTDIRAFLLTDATFGIAMKRQNRSSLQKYDTIPFAAAKLAKHEQLISEEMRLLYVALTRAAYRLVISGCVKNREKLLQKIAARLPLQENPSPMVVSQCACNLDFLLTALLPHQDAKALRDSGDCKAQAVPSKCRIQFLLYSGAPAPDNSDTDQPAKKIEKAVYDETLYQEVKKQLEYRYPYDCLQTVPAKLTASEFAEQNTKHFEDAILPVPTFAKTEFVGGASRGIAYHKFLQHCDFSAARKNLTAELKRLVMKNILTDKEMGLLSKQKLDLFFSSEVCSDILSADEIYREFPFRFLLPAKELYHVPSQEQVLIQGVVDLVYIKDNKAYIIDYKTDASADEKQMTEKYQPQLMIYQKAIEKVLNISVSQTILFSISAGKAMILSSDGGKT